MQRKHLAVLFVSLFLFSTGTGALAAGRSFDAELAEADQIRSAQPKEFLELLGQLQKQRKSATRSQEERLRYLEAYALGVYRDKPEESIRMASALFEQTKDVTLKYRAGSLVANLAGLKRDFSTGLRFLQKTLAIRNKVANKDIRHDGIGAAAVLYNEIGQYQIALNYAREMLADSPGPRTKCAAGYVEIQSQLELHQLPKGDESVQSVINACSSIHEVIPLNLSKVVLARKWAEEERLPDAVKLLEDALP